MRKGVEELANEATACQSSQNQMSGLAVCSTSSHNEHDWPSCNVSSANRTFAKKRIQRARRERLPISDGDRTRCRQEDFFQMCVDVRVCLT